MKTIHPSRLLWGGLALLFGLLLYHGYCWGWWGRSNLLFQLLFQCACPAASAESRYPERIDVIVPACRHDTNRLSPSGRLLYVEKKTLWNDNSYLLNLRTNKITPFTLPKGSKYFLTDDLLFLRSDYGKGLQGGEYILDRTMGVRYPIRDLDTNVNGEINVDILLEGLREAKYVFLVGSDDIVAIAPDYKDFPEHNFIANAFDIPGEEYDREEKFLQEQAIPYVQIPFLPHRDEALSPDGNFIARPDGIYLVKANQKIVDGFSATGQYRPYSGRYFSVIGWIYDGSGAIYSKFVNICMIEINFFEGPGCFMEIPQPVLKLKVPEEYLSPVSP